MLIQNVNNMAQASPPVRLAGNGTPDAVVVAPSNVETKPVVTVERVAAEKAAEQQPSAAQLQNMVDNINQAMKQSNKNLEFSVDEESRKSVVKLVDSETGDVIRQFPSDEMLAISKAIGQMQEQLQQATLTKGQAQSAQGLLVKQQA